MISILVNGIILMVLANTMAMTARERAVEYAVFKTLGFRPLVPVHRLISGESIAIAVIGGIVVAVFTIPGGKLFQTIEIVSTNISKLPLLP